MNLDENKLFRWMASMNEEAGVSFEGECSAAALDSMSKQMCF